MCCDDAADPGDHDLSGRRFVHRACPTRKQDCAGDLRVFRGQAARVYSLIRPPRTGSGGSVVSMSVTVARGVSGSSSGMCWAMPGAAGRVAVRLVVGQDGAQMPFAENRSRSRSSRRRVPTSRSQVAFMGGAWTAVRRILVPAAWKTASNEAVKFDPRSQIRNLNAPSAGKAGCGAALDTGSRVDDRPSDRYPVARLWPRTSPPPEGVWENMKNGMGNLAAGNAGELAAIVRARAAVAARR